MISERGRNLCFVLGLPRSGTTLLCALLAGHERVVCPPEPWVMLAVESMGRTSPSHPADPRLLGRAFREFAEHDGAGGVKAARRVARSLYNDRLRADGGSVLVDKTPRYYHILDYIDRVFPEATYVWIRRNPVDVAASYMRTWGVDVPQALRKDPGSPASLDFLVGLPRIAAFAEANPDKVVSIAYEDLVADPQGVVAPVFEKLGLEAATVPERPAETIFEYKQSHLGDRKILETAGVHARSVGAGMRELSHEQLGAVYAAVGGGDSFRALGYDDAADELTGLGLDEPDPGELAALREEAEALLAERWGRLEDWSDIDDEPPASVEDALEYTRARLGDAQRRSGELEFAAAERLDKIKELNADLDESRRKIRLLEKEVDRVTDEVLRLNNRTFQQQVKDAVKVGINRSIEMVADRRAIKRMPLISIVTPCYNAEDTIRETIESVLEQGYDWLHYIVVDGGSTDGTMDIVREYEDRLFKVVSEPDNGMYDAIGKGFEGAVGDVCGYLNADDVLEPGALQRIGEFFRDNKKVQVAYREDTIMIDGWRFPNAAQPHVDMWSLLKGHILFQDGIYFRGKAYRDIHGIDRSMKLAGDYDLWLRMSRKYKFVRVPGHVSCFRIREGQLSKNMDAYEAEQRESRARFRERMRTIGWARRVPGHAVTLAKNAWERAFVRRKMFYPVAFAGAPTPGEAPDPFSPKPACPLTSKPIDRLLFSTKDTRFRCPKISCVYYNDTSGVAVAWPHLDREQLNELYERWYSSGETQPVHAAAGTTSPYQAYYDKKWILGRLIRKLEMPYAVQKPLNHHAERGTWGDITYRDLRKALGRLVSPGDDSLRFLDAGCFEGELLDTIAERTSWQTFGLEANAKAVEEAREKGHTVFESYVEDAPLAVPEGQRFDVIFLGQVIEHLNEPVKAVQALSQLLRPGGLLVLSTPNLDSAQVRMFGPTWSHWHMPYHRVLFSRRALKELGRMCAFRTRRLKTYSNSHWTAYSLKVNELGVAGSAPHTWHPDAKTIRSGRSIAAWSRLLWNWRGMGDYMFAVYTKR